MSASCAGGNVGGRTLDRLAESEIDDEVQAGFWRAVARLHDRRVAHRRLTADALLVTADGRCVLTGPPPASRAAGALRLRLDVAQLLTVFALRVGPERAVAAAFGALGEERVAAAVPCLQPAGLEKATRADVRRYNGGRTGELMAGLGLAEDLLAALRARIRERVPGAPATPARLRRIRPRTVVTGLAGALAGYFVCTRVPLSRIDFGAVDARWWAVVLVAALVNHPAASMGLIGFVPEPLRFGRVLSAQFAGAFVKVVAPVQLAGVAFGTRFLQKAEVRPSAALVSLGTSQLALFFCRLGLLLVCGAVSGVALPAGLVPSWVLGVVLPATMAAGAAAAAVAATVPAVRRWVATVAGRVAKEVLPRLRTIVRRPHGLAVGLAGHLLFTVSSVCCLLACLRAFGTPAGFAPVAAALLTAHAVGSSVPGPGGLGAVEAALVAALAGLAHVPAETATPAVLLYRVLAFWVPVLPGWVCFGRLQRAGAL